jgi:FlaA1/EpsC-like NDP-sugar epimerase
MTIDAVLIVVSFLLAITLVSRDLVDIHYRWFEYLWMIGVLLAVKLFVFQQAGFYREIIRFVSMNFAAKIVKVTIFGSLIAIILIHTVRREIELPVLIVDWMASCILIGLSRFGWRYVKEGHLSRFVGKNTLLYGAGEHGAAVARHIGKSDHLGYRVVGFIDDDVEKVGKKVQGIPILGDLDCLPNAINEHAVDELVISFSNPDGELTKRIFRVCREHGVRCRIVPGMTDVISGNEMVRSVDIADLMRRPQRSLDKAMIGDILRGKRVLITGAAGSIGSEIFRQVLGYEPAAIGALDHSEYGLYKLDEEFSAHPLKGRCFFSLVDIKLSELVDETFQKFKPDIVFHAAAYKHVPILEQDVRQAVLNNVKGLKNVIAASKKNGVSKFVFISTDKAVRPTNVMGATKRIGELLVQAANNCGNMNCLGVRFGNVLASSGSVVPKFTAQIKAGGPVTVTHPDITRYFMLIPEAVELVLQAASLGKGGEIFVLDMGKPVKIAEMAEDLIALMGHVPHTGIPIVFTGLRPGEKLHEELFLGDIESPTSFKDIHIGKVTPIDPDALKVALDRLLSVAVSENADTLRAEICRIVPEYTRAENAAN